MGRMRVKMSHVFNFLPPLPLHCVMVYPSLPPLPCVTPILKTPTTTTIPFVQYRARHASATAWHWSTMFCRVGNKTSQPAAWRSNREYFSFPITAPYVFDTCLLVLWEFGRNGIVVWCSLGCLETCFFGGRLGQTYSRQ